MSLDVKDAVGLTKALKTTLAGGEHTPHHLVDGTVAVTDNGGSLTVDGTVELGATSLSALENIQVTFPSTQNVSVQNASLAVTGTFWQATQPVSGTFWQATQPVSGPLTDTELRATPVPVSGTFWQTTQPVSGTVTANAGTDLNTSSLALESTATSIKTAVETLDNAISGNEMQVDIVSSAAIPVTDNSGSLTVDGSVIALPQTGNVTEASTKTITTGGTHQQVFAANANRKFLLVQNVSDTDMNLGIGYNPTASTGIFLAKSGSGIVFESGFIPTQEIRILCATTGKAFVALEG